MDRKWSVLAAVSIVLCLVFSGITGAVEAIVQESEPEVAAVILELRREQVTGRSAKKDKNPAAGRGHYELLGVKWMTFPVTYVIDPTNPQGLSVEFVTGAVSASAEEWDRYTSKELFNNTYQIVYDATFDTQVRDGRNEVLFGDYPTEGVVAVTVIWYNRITKAIVETDVMFDIEYSWGDATVSGSAVMDLQNVATHEMGHVAGLDDVYNKSARHETMYGYVRYGETLKRDLYYGDIAGIQRLYG